MMGWRICALSEARLAEAWPLVRLRYPRWTLETWLAEARTLLAAGGTAGVLAAETDTGCIYAVCGYEADAHEGRETELALRIVANARWSGTADPLEDLVAAIEAVAGNCGCTCVRVDGAAIAAVGETGRWERLGYAWIGADLCKDLGHVEAHLEPGHRYAS
jgi:hypothetical protein